MRSSSDTAVNVYIGSSSPLLAYTPSRNGALGSAWFQNEDGSSKCEGSSKFAVQIDSLCCELPSNAQ